jgi:hypothetical protein
LQLASSETPTSRHHRTPVSRVLQHGLMSAPDAVAWLLGSRSFGMRTWPSRWTIQGGQMCSSYAFMLTSSDDLRQGFHHCLCRSGSQTNPIISRSITLHVLGGRNWLLVLGRGCSRPNPCPFQDCLTNDPCTSTVERRPGIALTPSSRMTNSLFIKRRKEEEERKTTNGSK